MLPANLAICLLASKPHRKPPPDVTCTTWEVLPSTHGLHGRRSTSHGTACSRSTLRNPSLPPPSPPHRGPRTTARTINQRAIHGPSTGPSTATPDHTSTSHHLLPRRLPIRPIPLALLPRSYTLTTTLHNSNSTRRSISILSHNSPEDSGRRSLNPPV